MALLLTAGTGKTSLRIASLITSSTTSVPFLLTSRRPPSSLPSTVPSSLHSSFVQFDFLDDTTWENALKSGGASIKAVYLIAPEIQDPSPSMIKFVDFAYSRGVRRFVLMSGLIATKGGPHVGGVWAHLDGLRESRGLRYAVMKCTWFMENFSEREHFLSLTQESRLYTSFGKTQIPFISATDIARVALTLMTASDDQFDKLLAETKGEEGGIEILGEESLDHDEAASILSHTLSHPITHRSLTSAEIETRFSTVLGMPPPRAKMLAWLQTATVDSPTSTLPKLSEVERVTGVKPTTFAEWVEENKDVWIVK